MIDINKLYQSLRVKPNKQLMFVSVSCFLGFSSAAVSADSVYKYKDKYGTVYQDIPTLIAIESEHSILNRDGLVIENIPAREERLRQAELLEARKRVERNDRALLATFSTEQDLIRARDDKVTMIDGYIGQLDERINILRSKLDVIERRIDLQEKSSEKARARQDLYDQRNRTLSDLQRAWELVDLKNSEKLAVSEKFRIDLSRYRYLKTNGAYSSDN